MKRLISFLLVVILTLTCTIVVSAESNDTEAITFPTGVSNESVVYATPIPTGTISTRISTDGGYGSLQYSSILNWAYAKTSSWTWGKCTYLYAEVTVSNAGSASVDKYFDGSNTARSIQTAKVYSSSSSGRYAESYHIVTGHHNGTEYYSANISF